MSVHSRGLLDCIPAWPLYCLHWLWCQEGQGDHLDISTPAFMLCVSSTLCGEGPSLEQVSDASSLCCQLLSGQTLAIGQKLSLHLKS